MWSSKDLFSGWSEDLISWVMVKFFRVFRE